MSLSYQAPLCGCGIICTGGKQFSLGAGFSHFHEAFFFEPKFVELRTSDQSSTPNRQDGEGSQRLCALKLSLFIPFLSFIDVQDMSFSLYIRKLNSFCLPWTSVKKEKTARWEGSSTLFRFFFAGRRKKKKNLAVQEKTKISLNFFLFVMYCLRLFTIVMQLKLWNFSSMSYKTTK